MSNPNTDKNSQTRDIADRRVLENLSRDLAERKRLKTLSDLELIREVLSHSIADDNRVLEMMERLHPRWFDEPEPPEVPKQPKYISVAVPFDVAVDLVAFSECHCEDNLKPCLWCACQMELYRATKDPIYKPEKEK